MIVLMGVSAISMLVVVVLAGQITGVVVCLGMVSVHMVVATSVVVGVCVSVPVAACPIMVVCVVVVAVVVVFVGSIVLGVGLGVVVRVVMGVSVVGSMCVVMVVVVCCCVSVSVVSLSGHCVQFLLSLSSLRLIDLTLHTGVSVTSGRVEEGSLTEALVSKLAGQEGAVISGCALGAGGLLDGVLHVVVHGHGHPGGSAADLQQSEALVQPALLIELLQGESDSLLKLSAVHGHRSRAVRTDLADTS